MMFGTRNKFKSVIATEAATIVAWSAAQHNDRIGGLIFSDDEHIEIKPRRGKSAVLDFIGRCTKHSAWTSAGNKISDHAPDKLAAVTRLRSVTHPGSLIFMISDFRDMTDKAFAQVANIARNNDIIMLRISDPFEVELPTSGSYKLTDGSKSLQLQASSKKIREEYRQRYLARSQHLENFCRRNRIHLIDISTDENILNKLKAGLGIVGQSNKTQYRSAKR